jgi:hypothetical protein
LTFNVHLRLAPHHCSVQAYRAFCISTLNVISRDLRALITIEDKDIDGNPEGE